MSTAIDPTDRVRRITRAATATAKPANETVPATYTGPRILTVDDAIDDLLRLRDLPVYPTPFPTLNTMTGIGGIGAAEHIVVSAPPGHAKTTLVGQVACGTETPVVIFTYEMAPGHWAARQGASKTGASSADYRLGRRDPNELRGVLPSTNHYVNRCPPSLMGQVVDRVADQYGKPPLVVVDYLQKQIAMVAQMQDRPDLRFAAEVTSNAILDLNQSRKVASWIVSANNRSGSTKVRGKDGRGPRALPPSELLDTSRESSAIEYDAAWYLSLHLSDEETHDDGTRVGTMTVAKSRHGIVGHIDMGLDGARGIWSDRGQVERVRPERGKAGTVDVATQDASKVEGYLRSATQPMSQTTLRELVGCSRDRIQVAISTLIERGKARPTGRGRSAAIELVTAGSEDSEP